MANQTQNTVNPWQEYSRSYRQKNPERVKRWRYNAALKTIREYEAEHPECREARLAGEA